MDSQEIHLIATLKPLPGKMDEVSKLYKIQNQGKNTNNSSHTPQLAAHFAEVAKKIHATEPGTLTWYAIRPDGGDELIVVERYGIFFTFFFPSPFIPINILFNAWHDTHYHIPFPLHMHYMYTFYPPPAGLAALCFNKPRKEPRLSLLASHITLAVHGVAWHGIAKSFSNILERIFFFFFKIHRYKDAQAQQVHSNSGHLKALSESVGPLLAGPYTLKIGRQVAGFRREERL